MDRHVVHRAHGRRCVTRINNAAGNQVTNAIVLTNSNAGRSWNFAGSVKKNLEAGLSVQAAYSYGESRTLVDPGSIASGSFTGNAISTTRTTRAGLLGEHAGGIARSSTPPTPSNFFGWGSTSVSMFWNAFTNGNTSYVFSGDMNGDTAIRQRSDLHPARSVGDELRAVHDRHRRQRPFTAQQQAEAFERVHRERSVLQRASRRMREAQRGVPAAGQAHGPEPGPGRLQGHRLGAPRRPDPLDITKFGNLLNSTGAQPADASEQILTNAAVDAAERLTYRMALQNGDVFTNLPGPTRASPTST